MTETYDPYANSIAKRVNGIFKHEFLLEQYQVKLPVMKELIKDSVRKYSVLKPHWSCYMKTLIRCISREKLRSNATKESAAVKLKLDSC